MKTLLIDIETTPNLAHVWGLWDQNIGLNQLLIPSEMLCFAAKWYGEPKMYFGRQRALDGDKEQMLELSYSLLNEADAVMHFNGKRFDTPWLNTEFALRGWAPPAPFQQIDLLLAIRKQFKLPSNKLEYALRAFGLEGKKKHEGHELWIKCMSWDPAAWRRMTAYNKRDVRALEDLYNRIQPWIPNHPNVALYEDDPEIGQICPGCGSTALTLQGHRYTSMGKYQRFQCNDCHKWSSSGKRVAGVDLREVRL